MTSEEIEPNGTKLESPSPAPTVTSFKSDQSMDQLVVFKDLNRTKPEAPSPAPTVASFKSDQSMDQLVVFKDSNSKLCPDKSVSPSTSYFSMKSSQPVHKTINFHDGNVRIKLEAPSPAPTVTSFKSDQSMDQLVVFKDLNRHRTKQEAPSPAPTASFKSDQSMDQLVVDLNRVLHTRQVTKDYLRCSVCKDVLREPVATPCGHGFCKTCIQSFWNKQAQAGKYPCPQCGKKLSPALLSQSYAGPGDMACDICTGKRKRAVKWCLTCSVAYCETHVRQHYTVVALQIHELRDVTGDPETRICYLHYRALEVFCKTDQIFICLVCVMEKHKNHDTVLAKREAQDFKVFLKNDMHHGELTAKFKRTEAEFSYLTIQFYRGLEDISDYAERAALGRQMDLGMLYDCRDDSFSKAWNINLSERKASLLVKLRKFQTVMKPVEITGWTDEECEMQSLLQCLLYISELSLSCDMVIKMAHDLRTIKDCGPVNLKQLSLIQRSTQQTSNTQSTRAAWLLQSSLASLLKRWKIKCLNLTESKMEAQSCIALLSYQGPLAIRFSEETLNELVVEVYEAQDEELTRCFLEKVGGEMSACCLTWGFIHYFLQHHAVTVDFRRTTIKQENIPELLPLLDRLKLTRLTSSFALSIMRKLYETGSVHIVSGLLNSTEKCINLENRQLNSVDCAALRFTLQHCTGVSLNLLWTSVPEGELQSIVSLLSHVSHLRVDRLLLLRLLHCCNIPELQKEAAVLLSALHHKLDFSCQDALDLTADTTTFNLTVEDCRVICMAILRAPENLYLNLCDCEVEEAGVMQLQTILHKVTLNCSERLLLKFDLKSAALEREKDLGPGPVDQWDWIWNIMNSCTA